MAYIQPAVDWVNVKNFGVRGDGVTDDTAAIQALINKANTTYKYAVLYFPIGEYLITSGLVSDATRAIALFGSGIVGTRDGYHNFWNGTVFVFKTTGAAYTGLRLGSDSLAHCGPQIEGINFVGVDAGGASTGGNNLSLLEIRNMNRWRVSYCNFRGANTGTGTGIYVNTIGAAGAQLDASWGRVEQITTEQVVHCIRSPFLEGGYLLTGSDLESTGTSIIHGGPQLRVVGNKFDGAPTAIEIAGGSANLVMGNLFEQIITGVSITDAGSGNRGDNNRVIGNHFRGRNGAQGEVGVRISTGCGGNIVKMNTFEVTTANVVDNGSGNHISQSG